MLKEEEIAYREKKPNFTEKTLSGYKTGGDSIGEDGRELEG